MAFSGESEAKRMVQGKLYAAIRQYAVSTRTFVCLAGSDFQPEYRAIAAEFPEASVSCADLTPAQVPKGVSFYLGDVLELLRKSGPVDVVNLDLCNNLDRPETLVLIALACTYAKQFFAVCVSMGQDGLFGGVNAAAPRLRVLDQVVKPARLLYRAAHWTYSGGGGKPMLVVLYASVRTTKFQKRFRAPGLYIPATASDLENRKTRLLAKKRSLAAQKANETRRESRWQSP